MTMPITLHAAALRSLLFALLAYAGLATGGHAEAATYFVRSDGGDARQCTGRVDAAYHGRGRGRGRNCAWKHPFNALPPGGDARIAGGDTLVIGPGDYMIGYGATGAGRCDDNSRWECRMPPVPSGPNAAAMTRILGRGHDSGCAAPPTLWGTERVDSVLNLEGSSNVEVGCLQITDHSDCVELHSDPAARCERDRAPYGAWASVGLSSSASHNVSLHDLNIHGLAHTGILAGGLRDWTLERVKINGNGWVGWDGDIGEHRSANTGSIVMRDIEIAWNGCGEYWQSGKVHACWAQQAGGYGDGLGTAATGGHWLIERARVHHNTSDGIDLLYLDGADSSVTLRQVYAAGNAGNQIKTRGTALIENSVVVGQCAYFNGRYDMVAGDHCRAQGNAISITLGARQVATVRHNTITGEGDCLILTEGGTATSRVEIHDNALLGQPDFLAGDGELTCGHYAYRSAARVSLTGNAFWNVKDRQCPAGNLCGRNPKLAVMGLPGFDPSPLPDSPLIDRATPSPRAVRDFRGQRRPVGSAADIGAVEHQK